MSRWPHFVASRTMSIPIGWRSISSSSTMYLTSSKWPFRTAISSGVSSRYLFPHFKSHLYFIAKCSMTFSCPLAAANCSGVLPCSSLLCIRSDLNSVSVSSSTIFRWPLAAARCNGLLPSLLRQWGPPLCFATRNSAISYWLFSTATWSGVLPSSSWHCGSQLYLVIKRSTRARCPLSAARCSGVSSYSPRHCGSQP